METNSLQHLIDNNRRWAERMIGEDSQYFTRLKEQQSPEYLWIGCSDSRVPANQITGLAPGEVFVHRNVANIVSENDFNVLAVIQYAVEVLRVKHVIICGHYGCGGVRAAIENQRHGLIDNWLAGLRALHRSQRATLDPLTPRDAVDRLCELNVLAQSRNVVNTTILEDAWRRGQEVSVHSWIYRLDCGRITALRTPVLGLEDRSDHYISGLELTGAPDHLLD